MTPIPLADLRLGPRSHASAMWWLGLLYRRPQRFTEALAELPKRRQWVAGGELILHVLLYVLVVSIVGRGLLTWVGDVPGPAAGSFPLEFVRDTAVGIAFGIAGSIAVAITRALAIAHDIAFGIAGTILLGISFGITNGIAFEIPGGIAGAIAFGIAFGIPFGIGGRMNAYPIAGKIAYSMAVGIAGAIAFGIALGIAFRTSGWIAGEIAYGIPVGIAGGIVVGIGIGFSGVMAEEISGDIVPRIIFAFPYGIVLSIIVLGIAVGIAFGIVGGIAYGIAGGIAAGIAAGIARLRVYYHPLHFWFVWPAIHGRWYPRHPAAWDDLCPLPFPGLGRLLVAYAEVAPEGAKAEIERLIDTYPSQRHQALIARTILLARAAAAETDLSRLDQIVASMPEGEKGFLRQTARVKEMVGEIAALQQQLETMKRPAFREPVAANLKERIDIFKDKIAGFAQPLASEFREAADRWLKVAQRQHDEVKSRLSREPTPQIFRAGEPVDRDIEAFVPRMPIIEQLESQIMLATGCPGLLIGGRRRLGKSTLIRNLIGFIPETLKVVAISMQAARAHASLAHLCELIAGEISGAAGLPPLAPSHDPPLVRLSDRLTAANRALAEREQRLLLAIDEFEQIDAKIGEGVFPTDLLLTVRESIQTHRQVIWAFVGVGDLAELPHATWSSYFVGLRSIRVPPFTPDETRRLLTEPLAESRLWRARGETPRFDPRFWGDGGINRIHTEAGGWPHLVQLLAETAVELANNRQLVALDAGTLEEAIDEAVERGTVVLSELIERECRAPAEWQYLLGFRSTETQLPPLDEQVRRSLRRRLLVVEEGERWRLRVPLMRRWLIKQA